MIDNDLLAPVSERRVVGVATLTAALRRKRGLILALAVIGAVAGAALSVAFPDVKTATTLVYVRFPDGTDASLAMPTELSILKTREVADAALHEIGAKEDPAAFVTKYRGEIVSTNILRIAATAHDARTAQRRAAAVADAYLAYRAQLGQQQLLATVSALKAQQDLLKQQIQVDDALISSAPATSSGARTGSAADVRTDRQQRAAQVQQIESTIQQDQVASQSVATASAVVDTAYVAPVSEKKMIAKNSVTGLVVGLALGIGVVLFGAVVTTRVRRRAEIATALQAPVVLSLGPVLPRGWRRLVHGRPTSTHPNDELLRLVNHLERALTLTPTRALVVVSIDSLAVARLAVLTLAARLRERGQSVSLVNETGKPLPDPSAPAENDDATEIVLVLAVLDPASGAEHLREWGSTATAIVTAGRSPEVTLTANATMLQSASIELESVVLVGSDAYDTTLGILPNAEAPRARTQLDDDAPQSVDSA